MKGLVLDGGGTLGIGQARILDACDLSKFDFFVGTSIGSANCAAIASGLDINLTDFFHEQMPEIFKGYWYRKYKLTTPRFNDKGLNNALKDMFDGSMGDVKKPLFVTSADLGSQRLKVFYSGDSQDGSRPLWEVIRSATAAETYFDPWEGRADGGIFANNPSMVAIAGACDKLNAKIEDIELCSIGTGSSTKNNSLNDLATKSYITWGMWLLPALLNGAASTMHEYFAKSLPIKKYERIQFKRDEDWVMYSPKDMLKAEKAWEEDIQKGIEVVNNF